MQLCSRAFSVGAGVGEGAQRISYFASLKASSDKREAFVPLPDPIMHGRTQNGDAMLMSACD